MRMQEMKRITARRSELDALAEELTKQLQETQTGREELLIAERVLNRLAEQERVAEEAVASTLARVAGWAVLLIPHRSGNPTRRPCLPAMARSLQSCGLPTARCRRGVSARSWALRWRCAASWNRCGRAKVTRLADRGWLYQAAQRTVHRTPVTRAGDGGGRGVTCGPPRAVSKSDC
jgi:hypothetical protein